MRRLPLHPSAPGHGPLLASPPSATPRLLALESSTAADAAAADDAERQAAALEAQLEELQRRKSAAEEAEAKAEAERGALEKAKEEALTARGVAEVAVRAVEASEADGVAQLVESEPPSGAYQPARMCAPTA